jgi:hypothetical protein
MAPRRFIPEALERVAEGDYQTARPLCSFLAKYVETGGKAPSDPELIAHLAEALKVGAAGGSVDEALGLKRGRGVTKWRDARRNHHICVLVEIFHEHGEPLTDAGAFATVAEKIAEHYGERLSAERVRNIWNAWKGHRW